MALASWQSRMKEVGLPEAVASLLVANGYMSEISFRRAFRSEESWGKLIEEMLDPD